MPHHPREGGLMAPGRTPGELLRDAAADDPTAWAEIVDRYGARLWHIARAHGLNAQDSADIVQFAWLKLVENLYTIRDPAAVGAWLATTVKHQAMRTLRKRSGEHLQPNPPDDTPETGADDDPVGAVLALDRGERLWQAVATLGEPCQSLLRLLVTEPDAGYRTLAIRLGMPVGSIGPTRGRCLARLRTLITEEV
ncbi:RNA polymerase sigma factor [Sinosporangium siamense]|uniref:RNA polymerase sigma factor n=1 Tax=Sinosporangium siamense TaxID=1367973 RepID=UPI001EF26452|nr:sigma-70 family RNA polymerase sigma factor [Sinosporangium siamense]